jgi:hypothetical protein
MFTDLILLFSQCGIGILLVLSEPLMSMKFLVIGIMAFFIFIFWLTVVQLNSDDPEVSQKQTIYF